MNETMTKPGHEEGNTQWLDDLRKAQTRQFVEDGFIHIDEYGNATLTDKGKQRMQKSLQKLPAGDEILIELAVLDGHGITNSAAI